jgi:hypothetical protein
MHAGKTLPNKEWIGCSRSRIVWYSRAIVAHASLDDPNFFNYIKDQESAAPSLELLAKFPDPVGFFGHTH